MKDENQDVAKLIRSGLSDRFIANYLSIDVQDVARAHLVKLVPVTRPFPVLEGLDDSERILALTIHGMSPEKIRRHLSEDMRAHQVARLATRHLGPARRGISRSYEYRIHSELMPLVHELLAILGRDRYTCEICLEPVPKGCVIHHTRYEGCTVYDLMYLCPSCNSSRENKGLQ